MAKNKRPHAQRAVSETVFDQTQQDTLNSDRSAKFERYWEEKEREKLRLLRRKEVEARTGLARSTIYDWMARGEFPQPVKLGARLVAWRESDITAWLESRETRAV